MRNIFLILITAIAIVGCGSKRSVAKEAETVSVEVPAFDADTAFSYVAKQVKFGSRVPNTEPHRRAGDWLSAQLKERGAEVIEQRADLKAFDGTILHARNIFGQFNPQKEERLLLLAHYDCRPWADEDPDLRKRQQPVDGANDGASGVGVLLELARQIQAKNPDRGVDILFVDAEDWGTSGDDNSWCLGSRYFVQNPIKAGYMPAEVILLDMVGAGGAVFPKEYFSQESDASLLNKIWSRAREIGYDAQFQNVSGGAIRDDHTEFINAGIPAIDIIDLRGGGFFPHWHTTSDNLVQIDRETLRAVGQTLLQYIYSK